MTLFSRNLLPLIQVTWLVISIPVLCVAQNLPPSSSCSKYSNSSCKDCARAFSYEHNIFTCIWCNPTERCYGDWEQVSCVDPEYTCSSETTMSLEEHCSKRSNTSCSHCTKPFLDRNGNAVECFWCTSTSKCFSYEGLETKCSDTENYSECYVTTAESSSSTSSASSTRRSSMSFESSSASLSSNTSLESNTSTTSVKSSSSSARHGSSSKSSSEEAHSGSLPIILLVIGLCAIIVFQLQFILRPSYVLKDKAGDAEETLSLVSNHRNEYRRYCCNLVLYIKTTFEGSVTLALSIFGFLLHEAENIQGNFTIRSCAHERSIAYGLFLATYTLLWLFIWWIVPERHPVVLGVVCFSFYLTVGLASFAIGLRSTVTSLSREEGTLEIASSRLCRTRTKLLAYINNDHISVHVLQASPWACFGLSSHKLLIHVSGDGHEGRQSTFCILSTWNSLFVQEVHQLLKQYLRNGAQPLQHITSE